MPSANRPKSPQSHLPEKHPFAFSEHPLRMIVPFLVYSFLSAERPHENIGKSPAIAGSAITYSPRGC
jgi:hypothetical protein